MTAYALHQAQTPELVAVWSAGLAHRSAAVCRLPAGLADDTAADLCAALTRLSTALWESYPHPDRGPHDSASYQPGRGFTGVCDVLLAPNLPDADGTVAVAADPTLEYGHITGRVLQAIGDADLTAAVTADVCTEIDAVARAGLGDLTGRAAQAVTVDHLDPSPAQVAAADHLLRAHPLGSPKLFTTVDPVAACVAAAHWLTAAADLTAETAQINPIVIFAWAHSLHGAAVETPAMIVQAVLGKHVAPRHVVTGMLTDAMAVAEGRVPDPAGLPDRVDAVREQVQQMPVRDPDEAVADMLESLTPLNPCRPSRDLLEQLLDGMYSCLIVYRDTTGDPPNTDPAQPSGTEQTDTPPRNDRRSIDQFLTAVRARAARDHDRLTR